MPTGSGYNPTLTLITLALRAAANIVEPGAPERRLGTGPAAPPWRQADRARHVRRRRAI